MIRATRMENNCEETGLSSNRRHKLDYCCDSMPDPVSSYKID